MRKEFEIQGCIEVPPEVTEDEFWNAFIEFVESKGWSFGGGIQEIQDTYSSQNNKTTNNSRIMCST